MKLYTVVLANIVAVAIAYTSIDISTLFQKLNGGGFILFYSTRLFGTEKDRWRRQSSYIKGLFELVGISEHRGRFVGAWHYRPAGKVFRFLFFFWRHKDPKRNPFMVSMVNLVGVTDCNAIASVINLKDWLM